MTKLIALIILLSLQALASPDKGLIQACGQSLGDCQFYQCLSDYRSCQDHDYPISFGQYYCEAFWLDQVNYSLKGQGILQEIRQCLQLNLLNHQHTVSCEQMRKQAYQSHVDCYLTSGFCHLPKKDKVRLLKTMNRELKNKDFLATAWRIEKSCLQIIRK